MSDYLDLDAADTVTDAEREAARNAVREIMEAGADLGIGLRIEQIADGALEAAKKARRA